MIQITKNPGEKWLELGAGENPHPISDVVTDVRKTDKVHFTVNYEEFPWPISSDEFHGIYSQFCIEHISWRNIPTYLQECYRILKMGGKLVLILPNTEAQIKWILERGWEKREKHDGDFIETSRILYGDLDYQANAHRSYFSPQIIVQLLQEAGFGPDILVRKFGSEIWTDMLVEAVKSDQVPPEVREASKTIPAPKVILTPVQPLAIPAPVQYSPNRAELSSEEQAKLFDRKYFNNYRGVGFMWDFPSNEVVTRHILARNPVNVIELGCGRGYILKRLEDRGVSCRGYDISRHCYLTRATNAVKEQDLLVPLSLDGSTDLFFSLGFLQYVPEAKLSNLVRIMVACGKRGLHGIDFTDKTNGTDPYQCLLRPREWWRERLPATHEIFDREELERGDLPPDVLMGDGKLKYNLGAAWTCYYWGWTNVDVFDNNQFCNQYRYKFQQMDITKGFPTIKTESAHAIVLHHVLEHFNYAEGLKLLRECRRVLRPDGVIRIAVPDAGILMGDYLLPHNPIEKNSIISYRDMSHYDEVNGECTAAPTRAGKLHAMLYNNHQAIYDSETLCNLLTDTGFNATEVEFRETKAGEIGKQVLRESSENSYGGASLFCEGIPRTN